MKTIRLLPALFAALGLVISVSCNSPNSQSRQSNPEESLSIGVYGGDPAFLVWVAEDRGYFSKRGLKISVRNYESGLRAAKDLLEGKVDLATATEFVAAGHILERDDLRIISSLCESDNMKLIARRDRGITQPSDIKNKRIGLLRGSVAEFYINLLMILNNIPFQEVQIVNLPPSEHGEAISKDEVDAVVTWEPFVTEVGDKLGTNALSWSAQSGQNYYWLLLGMEETVKKRPNAIRGFVSALVSAEEFIKNHGEEAKKIVDRKSDSRRLGALWDETHFRVGLDHPLILTMEAQMRWMDPRFVTRKSDMPDLLKCIYFDALNSMHPERIKMLH